MQGKSRGINAWLRSVVRQFQFATLLNYRLSRIRSRLAMIRSSLRRSDSFDDGAIAPCVRLHDVSGFSTHLSRLTCFWNRTLRIGLRTFWLNRRSTTSAECIAQATQAYAAVMRLRQWRIQNDNVGHCQQTARCSVAFRIPKYVNSILLAKPRIG